MLLLLLLLFRKEFKAEGEKKEEEKREKTKWFRSVFEVAFFSFAAPLYSGNGQRLGKFWITVSFVSIFGWKHRTQASRFKILDSGKLNLAGYNLMKHFLRNFSPYRLFDRRRNKLWA